MYLIWTKDFKYPTHCLFVGKTLEDVREKLNKFAETKKIKPKDLELVEYKLEGNPPISFSIISPEKTFFYTKIDDLENKKFIHILQYAESGQGQGYYEYRYLTWSYHLNSILKTAKNYFIEDSEYTDAESVKQMINNLKNKGNHEIENPIQHCCWLELYKLEL
jgi:hypothetical protein